MILLPYSAGRDRPDNSVRNSMDQQALSRQIEQFLAEDLGLGDITTDSIFPPEQEGSAVFVAKEEFIVAGVEEIAPLVFKTRNSRIVCAPQQHDGCLVTSGTIIFSASGPVRDLLSAERLALNLAQRLSGIATLTASFVEQVKGLPIKIVDTRKTTPGLRVLEKYAVRVGGGHNHRFNLARWHTHQGQSYRRLRLHQKGGADGTRPCPPYPQNRGGDREFTPS